jgi:predicted nucleic acid-binding protein
MILVDTSAWIEFLRASGQPVHLTLRHHLTQHSPIVTTEVVIMEMLAGTRSRREYNALRARLTAFPQLTLRALSDFEHAAQLYRLCREKGVTVRKLIDCLIATVAIRAGATVLHNDKDFDAIARCTRLRTEPLIP